MPAAGTQLTGSCPGQPPDSGFQLLVLDLDGFKAVNDSHANKPADQMLSEIGRVIRLQLRDYDFLGRYGGDEFVAIIPETRPEDVADLCRRIESAVTEFRLPLGDDIFAGVGISLGASSYPQHGSTFDDLLATADREMYRVKASRKRQDLSTQIGLESRLYSVSEADVIPDMILDSYAIEIDDENIISSALN